MNLLLVCSWSFCECACGDSSGPSPFQLSNARLTEMLPQGHTYIDTAAECLSVSCTPCDSTAAVHHTRCAVTAGPIHSPGRQWKCFAPAACALQSQEPRVMRGSRVACSIGSACAPLSMACVLSCRDRQPLKPYEVTPMRPVPASIQRPPYAASGKLPPVDHKPQVHNAQVSSVCLRHEAECCS